MDPNSAMYNSTVTDMRSQMARSLDRETDLARSYSNMSFINREPILPMDREMATIRGTRITDYRKVQEIKDNFDEDHHEMLNLRDYKDWIKENIMGTAIEHKEEFARIEKFRRKMNNVKDALEEETADLDEECRILKDQNNEIRKRLAILEIQTKTLEDKAQATRDNKLQRKASVYREGFFLQKFSSGIPNMQHLYIDK